MTYRTNREHFDRLAEQALKSLPEEFRKRFENITISVEDYPSSEDIRATGLARYDLLGIFRGAGYPNRGGFFDLPPPLPDEIVLFQKNIESISFTGEDLIEEIRLTLIHEVGHYFGMSEEDLKKYD
jgi:predicted Zn-dependent protease with MMP-like domain